MIVLRPLIFILLLIFSTLPAWATDRYIDGSATGCTSTDNDYDPITRACGSGSELFYSTFAAAHAAAVAGDNIYFRAGTYTENWFLNSKVGAAGAYITIKAFEALAVTVQPTDGTRHQIQNTSSGQPGSMCTTGYHHIEGFIFDGVNQLTDRGLIHMSGNGANGCSGLTPPRPVMHHFTFKNNEIKNQANHFSFSGAGHRLIHNKIHDNRSDCVGGNRYYGSYVYSGTTDLIMEYNEVYNTAGGYFQIGGQAIVRYNYYHDNAYCGTTSFGGNFMVGSRGSQFYNNIVISSGSAPGANSAISGLQLFNTHDILVRNNIFYDNPNGAIDVTNSDASGHICENNIIVENGGATIRGPGSCTQITNKTTGVINDYTVSTTNFTLKSGSPCINFGTARSGFAYNGSAPDCGAFESIPAPTASITENKVTVIFPMGLNTPLTGLSTTGVTVGCTGAACPGSPTVSGVSPTVGTNASVDVTIAGIAANACAAANQTWTISYNSATGSWADNAKLGYTDINQKIFSFTSLAVTNLCTGSGPPTPPAGMHIHYKMDEGAGTNLNDETANNLDGTLTNTPTWGTGKTGSGVTTAMGTTQHIAVPYGNTINPSSQSLTIVLPVFITPGQECVSRSDFGTSNGTNQRLYIGAINCTWRIGIQSSPTSSAASNLSVTAGWNFLILILNSGTDVATLYKGTLAGTGGASKSYTSYAFASNFKIGLFDTNTAPGATYDEFLVYTTVEDPADLLAAFEPNTTPTGTFSQATHRFQRLRYGVGSTVENLGAVGATQNVIDGGAVAIIFQVNCDNVSACASTAFALYGSIDGTNFTRIVPDVATSDGFKFVGDLNDSSLVTGEAAGPLTGSLTHTNGTTQRTSSQVPNVTLSQNTSLTLRYLIAFETGLTGQSRWFLLKHQNGDSLGSYNPSSGARVDIIPSQSTAGF